MIEIRHKRTGEVLWEVHADTLAGADLQEARLTGADLRGADLRSADLREARLSNASLAGVDMSAADLREATLSGADLTGANLAAADLTWARLRRARLIDANLRGAVLCADVCGADLSGATLTGANLADAEYDRRTRWPDGFDAEGAGADLVEHQTVRKADIARVYEAVLGTAPRWIIKWGLTLDVLDWTRDRRLSLRYGPPIYDKLDWGPQHVDLQTQAEMRQRFFRSQHPQEDLARLDAYVEALESGDEVLFWCDPTLPSCLAILWALDGLRTRGADLRRAYLVLSPVDWPWAPLDEAAARRAFENRVPVAEVIEPLVAVRRHLASDSEEVPADLSALSAPVRAWAAVTDLLADYLPDERGLDLIDSLLLDGVTDEWQMAPRVVGEVSMRPPRGHSWGDIQVYEQLLELGGYPMFASRPSRGREDGLIEARFRNNGREMRFAHVRITELGRQVRDGEADALQCRPFSRWVGGRHITNERPLRRQSPKRYPAGAPAPGEGAGSDTGRSRESTASPSLPRGELGGLQLPTVEMRHKSTGALLASVEGGTLCGASLLGADLREADLAGRLMDGADLHEAKLQGAALQKTDLSGASLGRAQLQSAQMQEAFLAGAEMAEADLTGSDAQGADLAGANLTRARLPDASLQGADLRGARLSAAELRRSDLRGASLYGADLTGAGLSRARLAGADLRFADLAGADLTEADLSGAYLDHADLSGADLRGARLNGAVIEGARYDGRTWFPEGFDPQQRGALLAE